MPEPVVTYNVWAAARLRAGADPETIDASRLSGVYLEWLGAVRAVNGGDRRAAFDHFIKEHPEGKRVNDEIFRVDIGQPAPTPEKTAADTVMVDVPDLPQSARLTTAMTRVASETGEYLTTFSDYVYQIANTLPRDFSVAAALWTVSLIVARRLHTGAYFEPQIFPVLWVLWVAESTIFHKTTGLNLARRLVRHVVPHLLLPEESSRDALIHDMAGRPPANMDQMTLFEKQRVDRGRMYAAQRGIVVDEASSLFSGFRKDYNAGAVEVFLKAYDCEDEKIHSTLKHGNIYVRWMYLPLLGATTPASIQQASNLVMWQNGFWPRFVPLVPERVFPERPHHHDDILPRPEALDQALLALNKRLPEPTISLSEPVPPKSIHVAMDPECWKHWKAYSEVMGHELLHPDKTSDDRLRKLYGRMPVKLMQVATLLAALDWPDEADAPRIRLPHYAAAHQIVETWRVNAHRFVAVMDRPLAGEDHERRILHTIVQLAKQNVLATTRELHRVLHWPRDKIEACVIQMEKDGLIAQEKTASGRTGYWRVCEEEK